MIEMLKDELGAPLRDFSLGTKHMFGLYGNDRLYEHPNPFIRHIQERRIDLTRKFLDLKFSDEFLDVGAGEGAVVGILPKTCRRVDVGSPSQAIQIARDRNSDGVTWLEPDVRALPFEDSSFDNNLCTEVIEHLPCPERAKEQ
jgi:ubiquinone/menaquinone biosynthesis C-methylase UbiE